MIKYLFKFFEKISEYNYLHIIKKTFGNLDKLTKQIMKSGFKFCFCLGIIALLLLVTYNLFFTSPTVFYIGFGLLKTSLMFAVEFIICGFVVDKIKAGVI